MMKQGLQMPTEMKARRAVRIHISGGVVLEGNLVVPRTKSIGEVLNGTQPFLEFETSDGSKMYIYKPTIGKVQIMDYPKPRASSAVPDLLSEIRDQAATDLA